MEAGLFGNFSNQNKVSAMLNIAYKLYKKVGLIV